MYEQIAKPGDRIQEALQDNKMTASELAVKTGIHKSSISCWISGKYEPKQMALYKMGRALNVAEMWLAGYDVPKERTEEQKQSDLLSDVTERAGKDSAFLALLKKECGLTEAQILLISQLIDQIIPPT